MPVHAEAVDTERGRVEVVLASEYFHSTGKTPVSACSVAFLFLMFLHIGCCQPVGTCLCAVTLLLLVILLLVSASLS